MIKKLLNEPIFRYFICVSLAIATIALLPTLPPLSFQEDKGILYIRSFEMDMQRVVVTQTELASGAKQVVAEMSVKGLWYCYRAMLILAIISLFFFFSRKGLIFCDLVSILAGAYYVLLIYYAMRISDLQFATLTPTLTVVLPALTIQAMILARRCIVRSLQEESEEED